MNSGWWVDWCEVLILLSVRCDNDRQARIEIYMNDDARSAVLDDVNDAIKHNWIFHQTTTKHFN